MSVRPSSPSGVVAARLAPWIAIVLLAAWSAAPHPAWLAAAAAALLLPLMVRRGPAPGLPVRSGVGVAGLLVALAAVPLGFLGHHRVSRVLVDFEAYWEDRESRVFADLQDALNDLVDRGDAAVEALARAAGSAGGAPAPGAVRAVRRQGRLAGAAVYGPPAPGDRGEPPSPPLLVWDGIHRGPVPEEVQAGTRTYLFGQRPLFSYLYFTRPVPGTGGTAVVTALLSADLPGGFRAEGDLVSEVSRRDGETIRVGRPDGGREGAAAFDFVSGSDTLFSVAVTPPAPEERALRVETFWLRVVAPLILLAWLLLAVEGWGRRLHARRAALALLGVAALLPFGRLLATPRLFSVEVGVLSGFAGPTVGRLLVLALVALAVSPLLWTVRRPRRRWVPPALVALAFPALAALLHRGTPPGFLAGDEAGWVSWQATLALTLSLVAAGVLAWASEDIEDGGGRLFPGARALGVAVAGAVLLAVAGGVWVRFGAGLPVGFTALWALVAFPAIRGVSRWTGWRRSAVAWMMAAVLGGSAALPVTWASRIEARMDVAESQMARLGVRPDPYLHYLLGQLAGEAARLDERGAEPLELLYRGWIDSGLAQEGYPVWLTLHGSGGFPRADLRLGVSRDRPSVAREFFEEARGVDTVRISRVQRPEAHYVATVPLSGGVLTAVVPPLREIVPVSSAGPLFGRLSDASADPLTLVPLDAPAPAAGGGSVIWVRTARGWRGETRLDYPEGPVHAHYLVAVAGPLLLVARGTLLLAMTLGLALAAWAGGRLVFLGARPVFSEWMPLVTSFRARVTLALFAFFLLSIAIFGTLAYQTVSAAAERAARVLAERVVADAAGFYLEFQGNMALLAQRVDADLLEYRGGELREGSPEELVELGLYEGWLPHDVWSVISAREEVLATRDRSLGPWEYLVAYRLLPDDDVLGVPVSREAGATAVQRREVAHLLGFAVVAGGVLSFLLALLVGRTLARPIHTLQVAAERVGGGNLDVRLPDDQTDEFGSVFVSFNRMVRRLRRARRDLVRTTRRTQAIVDDAATGVVALDATGRVRLANPRAERLLGMDVEVGTRLRETGAPADEFVRWVQLYFRDGLREVGTEFQLGERRLRVRARRISREGPLGGAVLSVEDVTDELRTERVLAWGEMARQVAHEVKNPLTPIKLSIQHIRRAWEDRRPDFDAILGRNAEAALREIDRLATIASSFSRFGAPEAADEGPLEAVDLEAVISEVMTLYASGEGAIRFEMEVEGALPRVAARATEVKEVLVNLLENARSAIEVEGTVRISAAPEAGDVVLRVDDDGSGIPEELLPRVFEPHFSTRSTGTGLGLAIVKRLVESWDGSVAVHARPAGGTRVEIRLRAWEDGAG